MTTENISSFDGTQLQTRTWLAENNTKGNIIFCHGLFEYAGRYAYEAEYFNLRGYDFYSFDQRTHGESGGKRRAYIRSFEPYAKDYEVIVHHIIEKSDKPIFLFSHSMGCTVMLTYLISQTIASDTFRGVIMSGPFLKAVDDMAPILQKLAGIVARLLPNIKTIAARPNTISRDKEEVRKYINDPLVYTDGMYAVTGYNMLAQSKWLMSRLEKFDYPFLIMHGTDDALANIQGSEKLYEVSPSQDKTFIPLKDHKHEITRELERDKVLQQMTDWMDERL